MTILQMKYLLALDETKKIYLAAQKCFISQSAFSQNLSKLEVEIGTPLFIRTNNEWLPTAAGALLLDACRRIVDIYQDTEIQIRNLTTENRTNIALSMSPERAQMIMTRVYPLYFARYPSHTIQLVEGPYSYLKAIDKTSGIDFGLSAIGKDGVMKPHPMLNYISLCPEELVLITAKEHRLAHMAAELGFVPVSELDQEPFIQHERTKNIYCTLHSIFHKHKIAPVESMFFNSISTCVKFVQNNLGVSIVPKMLVQQEKDISIIHLSPALFWDLNIVYNKTKVLSTSDHYLIRLMQERVQQILCDSQFKFS